MLTSIILVIALIIMALTLIMSVRNFMVFSHRRKKIELVSKLAQKEINEGRRDWHRWYDMLESVSYYEMVWKFWKPLDSFYPPELLNVKTNSFGRPL